MNELQGWSLPLSPNGGASLVPPPPWHFSGEALGVDFIADPGAVAAVLPAPLRPRRDGAASFVFVDWSSSAEADPRLIGDPGRGQYSEAYVCVFCTVDGQSAARVPYIWVDSDLSLARGHIQGFPKKFGSISISRPVRVGRGGPKIASGGRFVAHVSALGRRLADASVTLAERAEEGTVPRALRSPIWHTRLVPNLVGDAPLVCDLVRNVVTDFAVADVWTGSAELALYRSEFEELDLLAPVEVTGGFRCAVAFTVTGATTRQ